MARFQVKLGGTWTDYDVEEDAILKRAFQAGFPHARYSLRKTQYEVDFGAMQQRNTGTGKGRQIRAPHRWKPPREPIVPKGPTVCITVPEGGPGTAIQIPHPQNKGLLLAVQVPLTAKVGQAMLVPVPPVPPAGAAAPGPPPLPSQGPMAPSAPPPSTPASGTSNPAADPAAAAPPAAASAEKGASSGGSKVALGVGVAAVGVAGLAVAGAMLPEEASAAADGVAAGAEAAVDWVGDTAEDAGDFIMDLF